MKKIISFFTVLASTFTLFSTVSLADVSMYSEYGSISVDKSEVQYYKNMGWYDYPIAKMYAPDGREQIINKEDVEDWENVGWYNYPVAMMYAPDGREQVINREDVEAWESVGWYSYPVTIMYAPDGREEVINKDAVEAWENVGWYSYPVVRVYAVDGREQIINKDALNDWLNVGWYQVPVTILYAGTKSSVVAKSDVESWLKVGWRTQPMNWTEQYVNRKGLSSSTSYLVWVSKSEYKVRVYTGSKNNWNLAKTFTCAIGKPSTPTCEGTFKYYQAQKMWDYGSYYVGPIMRFNGGYAIHSTLIYKNGVPKDNRVGMKLSLGCVRLRPNDINWMASSVPLYTTIHITG